MYQNGGYNHQVNGLGAKFYAQQFGVPEPNWYTPAAPRQLPFRPPNATVCTREREKQYLSATCESNSVSCYERRFERQSLNLGATAQHWGARGLNFVRFQSQVFTDWSAHNNPVVSCLCMHASLIVS